MSVILTQSMFIGEYAIAAGPLGATDLQNIIDRVEPQTIKELFGNTMGTDFLNDISSGVPQDPDYLTLFNALMLEDPCTFENYSTGIVEMLKCLVFNEWYTSRQANPTTTGQKKLDSSNSRNYPDNSHLMFRYYNRAIGNYKVIQEYCEKNLETNPDFDGYEKDYASPL